MEDLEFAILVITDPSNAGMGESGSRVVLMGRAVERIREKVGDEDKAIALGREAVRAVGGEWGRFIHQPALRGGRAPRTSSEVWMIPEDAIRHQDDSK